MLSGRLASLEIQPLGGNGRVLVACAHVRASRGTRLPSGQLVSISDLLVENMRRTAPYMEVAELAVGRLLSGEHLEWTQASVFPWRMVDNPQCVESTEGPKRCVAHIGPMHSLMVQLGASQRHKRGDGSFGHAIAVMRASGRMFQMLVAVAELGRKIHVAEGGSIVREAILNRCTMLACQALECIH